MIDTFIQANNLRPADAVVVKKQPLKLLNHFVIYLGHHYGEHKFIANYTKGTRILTYDEIQDFSRDFSPEQIMKFRGNEIQRDAAVQRALSRKDQTSYHLLANNCEHYSTYVQTGEHKSSQVSALGKSLLVGGLITAASCKKEDVKAAGFLAAFLGLITLAMDDN